MGNIKRFITATVDRPFGLAGYVKITSPSGEVNHLFNLDNVILRLQGENQCFEKPFQIENVLYSPLSIKFAGINSLEDAKSLNGAAILVPREQAAPLYAGEFYIEDLRGLSVFAEGKELGIINDLLEGGGGFLAEILLQEGKKRLVPFRNEFFGQVDIMAGKIELRNTWILE